MLRDSVLSEIFIRQNRVTNYLPQDHRRLLNLSLQKGQLLPHFSEILVPVVRVLMQQLHNNLAHVITQNVVFEKVWNLVDV